jgi:hypothetical protein
MQRVSQEFTKVKIRQCKNVDIKEHILNIGMFT